MKRSRLIAPAPAFAVVLLLVGLGTVGQDIFTPGFSYPLQGVAHVLASIGVGIWAARLGRFMPVVLPTVFVLGVALGVMLAIENIRLLVFAEPMIWVSALALLFAAIYAVHAAFSDALGIVGLFGLYHGYALGGALGSFRAPLLT